MEYVNFIINLRIYSIFIITLSKEGRKANRVFFKYIMTNNSSLLNQNTVIEQNAEKTSPFVKMSVFFVVVVKLKFLILFYIFKCRNF